ncbi:glycerol kinase [Arenicella chitinivorans]|uniref:Glycerol kinase n=1 Tax=Arenicella chitinivorans TaxID=1329800 RepID=A0A918RSS4_9GAMM|nr:glycerol kinase GlpK [Arenicella chitinivorans]GHA09410.1 glycerol kinase [Arenicella chitinivorans]
MSDKMIIALDQGTTSSRAILFNHAAEIVGVAQQEFTQHYPGDAWVEHDAQEIWDTQSSVLASLIAEHKLTPDQIAAIGITNQRETTVVWDKATGEPVYNAIVWQDRRTAARCDELVKSGWDTKIREKTGLIVDSYFSATKLEWILNNVDGARARAERGELLFGTIDTWVIWNLTGGKVHATDASNAARTMLLNIDDGDWDQELLELFGIPAQMLPEVCSSSDDFGSYSLEGAEIPITGVAGDQQAALFGQTCFEQGMAKNTYGTGCFMLMNTGAERVDSQHGLLTTIAWSLDGKITYALEGSVFIAGAAVQWLRDELQFIESAEDSEALAEQANPESQVVVVPAFAGLGAPHWDMYARGAIFGLTRDSGRAEIAKATLQSLAYQIYDVLNAMQQDSGIELSQLNVDGGAIANDFLAQFQADVLQKPVIRPKVLESTALGAAYLAGLKVGYWTFDDLSKVRDIERTFDPKLSNETITRLLKRWNKAVERAKHWVDIDE